MKKIICVLLMAVMLCGCNNQNAEMAASFPLECEAHIFYYGEEYRVNIKTDNGGKAEYLVTYPKNLKDFTLLFCDGNVTAGFRGLNYYPSVSALPYGGAVTALYNMQRAVLCGEYTVAKHKKQYRLNGVAGNIPFCLYVTAEGLPVKAVFGDGFTACFTVAEQNG